MKRLLLFALLTALLTACNDNMENPLTPTQKKIAELMAGYDGKIDMAAFLAAAQQGIWQFDTIDTTYTNGETYDGIKDGSTDLHTMMLRSAGECRIMLSFMFNPAIPRLYQPITWNVSASQPNTIELYSEKIEQKAATYQYDQYAARNAVKFPAFERTAASFCAYSAESIPNFPPLPKLSRNVEVITESAVNG